MERQLILKLVAVTAEIAEVEREIEALKSRLREERAEGDMLTELLSAMRAELRLLQSGLMTPDRQDRAQGAPTPDLEGANRGDKVGATEEQRDRMSEPGRRIEATACSSSQVFEDEEHAVGDCGEKTVPFSKHSVAMEKDGEN